MRRILVAVMSAVLVLAGAGDGGRGQAGAALPGGSGVALDQPRCRRHLRRQAGLSRRLRDRRRQPGVRGPARDRRAGRGPERRRVRGVGPAHAVRDRRRRVAGLVRRGQERALRPARHAARGGAAHGRRAPGGERRDPVATTATPGPIRWACGAACPRSTSRMSPSARSTRSSRRISRWCRRPCTTGRRTAATCSPTSSTTTRPTRWSTPTCACCRRATARSRSSRC